MIKAYLAGSIFYIGDKFRNEYFDKKLREAFPTMDLYDPLENTAINGPEGKKHFAGSKEIAEADCERLDNTDILIVCLDNDVIPSGSSCEIGIMREKIRRGEHKYVVGIATDNREMSKTHSLEKDLGGASDLCENQYCYLNLFTIGAIKQSGVLVDNIDDAIAFIKTIEEEYEDNEEYSKEH